VFAIHLATLAEAQHAVIPARPGCRARDSRQESSV
jgi:hypothetical protein